MTPGFSPAVWPKHPLTTLGRIPDSSPYSAWTEKTLLRGGDLFHKATSDPLPAEQGRC